MLARILDFSTAKLVSAEKEICKECGLPLYCNVQFLLNGVRAQIEVDWRGETDAKDSWARVDGQSVWINHTQERVTVGEKAYDFWKMQRLESHYYNYFTCFEEWETQQARRIHEFLFAVNERL